MAARHATILTLAGITGHQLNHGRGRITSLGQPRRGPNERRIERAGDESQILAIKAGDERIYPKTVHDALWILLGIDPAGVSVSFPLAASPINYFS